MSELCRLTATETVSLLRRGEIKPTELVEASVECIKLVDGTVNALPIHCFDRAREQAEKQSSAPPTDDGRSFFGLPIAVKDYNDAGGVRTTYVSPIFTENIGGGGRPLHQKQSFRNYTSNPKRRPDDQEQGQMGF